MNIFYVILSGIVFKDTRNIWAQQTWIKEIDKSDDYAFLEGESDASRKVLGFNTPEGHFTSYLKLRGFYLHYYENKELYEDYEWFFFADSDTYVMPKRAKSLLKSYSPKLKSPMFIGRLNMLPNSQNPKSGPGSFGGETKTQIIPYLCNQVPLGPWFCHSGGSGWAMNKSAVEKMSNYLIECGARFPWSQHYDLAHALWLNDCDIPMMHSRLFRSEQKYRQKEFCDYLNDDVVTYHYMKEQDFYGLYGELKDK